mgnify:CR=1 FL=1|tara:strand:- start:1029 stop:1649 length:621 start_codon:yes stop_codon:yes gene_type:complete
MNFKKDKSKYFVFKRICDLVFATFLVLILSPLIIIVYLTTLFFLGKPAIFKQKRPGINNNIFTIFKFRSLLNKKDKNNKFLPDKERLTSYGRCIRSLSLDELPQLYNILKGEMSFVGPRPLKVEYLKIYSDEQIKRHSVKPGLTGLTQVNGRNSISWEEKFNMDLLYVRKINFFLDFSILMKTILSVIFAKNISKNCDGTNDSFSK